MADAVSSWVQTGRLYVWCYADARKGWRGWHFTGDPVGCSSLRNLLDRMHGGELRHRTLRLDPVTEAILSVPNAGYPTVGCFATMRVEYVPDFDELRLLPEGDRLTLTIGKGRLRKLAAALAEVEAGVGDFGIKASDDRKADPWMFWWMPDINYQSGKRL